MGTTKTWLNRLAGVGASLVLAGVVLDDAPAARWMTVVGATAVLLAVTAGWWARRSPGRGAVARVAIAGALLAGCTTVASTTDGPAATPTGADGSTTTAASATPSSELPLPEEDPVPAWFDKYDPAYGIEEGGGFGWGSIQPPNMRMIHLGSSARPLAADRRAQLGEMLQRARNAGLRIKNLAGAKAAGYTKVTETSTGGRVEYVNYQYADDVFDVDHPEQVVFAANDADRDDSPVIAIAYGVMGTYEEGPPEGFPLEYVPWHFHGPLCMAPDGSLIADMHTFTVDPNTYIDGKPATCEEHGGTPRPDLASWMVDLWVMPGWENPYGLISSKHPDLVDMPWQQALDAELGAKK